MSVTMSKVEVVSVHDATYSDVRSEIERLVALILEFRERNAANLARLEALESVARRDSLPAELTLTLIQGGRDA